MESFRRSSQAEQSRPSLAVDMAFSMGRAIKMERLATANSRQNTYSKRKFGIIKKAKELSILCDVDVLLVMFSPAGRPTMYLGEYSDFNTVLRRFSEINIRERIRRKREIIDVLAKMFEKLGQSICIKEPSDASQVNEMYQQRLKSKLKILQASAAGASERLSCWEAPDKVHSLAKIQEMEKSLLKSLKLLHSQKEHVICQSPNHHLCKCTREDHNTSTIERDLVTFLNSPAVNEDAASSNAFAFHCERLHHHEVVSTAP